MVWFGYDKSVIVNMLGELVLNQNEGLPMTFDWSGLFEDDRHGHNQSALLSTVMLELNVSSDIFATAPTERRFS